MEYNLENRIEEVKEFLLENSTSLDEAIYAVYDPYISVEDIPKQYILQLYDEIFQCPECGEWFYIKDESTLDVGYCKDCGHGGY